jgi:GT2 family glycosyltransferase
MKFSTNFGVGIPTINRWDLLKPSLLKYIDNFPEVEIYVLDNGNQGISIENAPDNLHIIPSVVRVSVAEAWNFLCSRIFVNNDYSFILNDDCFVDLTLFDVENHIANHSGADFIVSMQGYCSFILPKETYKEIGKFDVNFKGAYFEDKDYERRLKLANKTILRTKTIDPVYHYTSASIGKDLSLNENYQNNAQYYVQKWGGNIGGETFLKPFNK